MNETKMDILKSIRSLRDRTIDISIEDSLSPERLSKFQVSNDLLSFDFSKQRITQDVLGELLLIPDKINLRDSLKKLSEGRLTNFTEEKKVSHMSYRAIKSSNYLEEREEISKQINKLEVFIKDFVEYKQDDIQDVICIGIGGSRLGPELLSQAFENYSPNLNIHYCSSYDYIELENALKRCKAKSSLLVISSKSFSTVEVISNAKKAIEWLHLNSTEDPSGQIIGISSNTKAMTELGIEESNQFKILESLSGRYSVWSSISLPAIISIGLDNFDEFKQGAFLADKHFLENDWDSNIPVLMALLSLWNMNCLGIKNLGIFTYDYRIRSLSKYLAQLTMESNGKIHSSENKQTPFFTCPLVWGGYGPDMQHSLFQWLLQGPDSSTCDFIGVRDSNQSNSYDMLLAQVMALSLGENNELEKYKTVQGNTPLSLLKLDKLSPRNLGFLIACYEHKVFVESQIYGINAFDQWGVQLGKRLTKDFKAEEGLVKKFFHNKFFT